MHWFVHSVIGEFDALKSSFLREQLKNKDEVIHSLLQQLAIHDNVVVECNNVSILETSDKIHCSQLSNHK